MTHATDRDRCADVDQSVRCQLLLHHDGQHAAMISFEAFARYPNRVSEYRQWGEPWTKARPGQGPLPWAATFPRVAT